MKKVLLFIFLTVFWIFIFFPKDTLWESFVRYASTKDIYIFSGKTEDKKYEYVVKKVKVYFKNLELAEIQSVVFKPWLLYNQLDFQNSKLNKNLPMVKDFQITGAKAVYSLFSPLKVEIDGTSKYGSFTGEIFIFSHKGYVLFKNNKIKNGFFQQYFKKTKKGMRYEFDY